MIEEWTKRILDAESLESLEYLAEDKRKLRAMAERIQPCRIFRRGHCSWGTDVSEASVTAMLRPPVPAAPQSFGTNTTMEKEVQRGLPLALKIVCAGTTTMVTADTAMIAAMVTPRKSLPCRIIVKQVGYWTMGQATLEVFDSKG